MNFIIQKQIKTAMQHIQMHLPGSSFGWIGVLEVTTLTKWAAVLLLLLAIYDTGTGAEVESRDAGTGAMEPVRSDCQEQAHMKHHSPGAQRNEQPYSVTTSTESGRPVIFFLKK